MIILFLWCIIMQENETIISGWVENWIKEKFVVCVSIVDEQICASELGKSVTTERLFPSCPLFIWLGSTFVNFLQSVSNNMIVETVLVCYSWSCILLTSIPANHMHVWRVHEIGIRIHAFSKVFFFD